MRTKTEANYEISCKCGCGLKLLKYDNQNRIRQYIKGHYLKIQDNNPNWMGGRYVDGLGYVLIMNKDHPRPTHGCYVYEHILVMEKHLGRYMREGEIIHHINHNRQDNRIENLYLTNPSEHARIHATKDLSDRICFNCDSKITYIDKHGWPQWYNRDNHYFCRTCFEKLFRYSS